jgi:hypothetical protein
MGARRAVAVGTLTALAVLAGPEAGSAQRMGSGTGLRVTGLVGGSFQDSPTAGLGLARDVVSYSLRLSLRRGNGIQPWVQGGWFTRPDLVCPADLVCSSEGWTLRGGAVMPFFPDDTRPGVQPYLLAGLGGAFSERNRFSVLLGIGAAVPLTRWFAPVVELQWDQLPEISNVLMVNLGLRIDLF